LEGLAENRGGNHLGKCGLGKRGTISEKRSGRAVLPLCGGQPVGGKTRGRKGGDGGKGDPLKESKKACVALAEGGEIYFGNKGQQEG